MHRSSPPSGRPPPLALRTDAVKHLAGGCGDRGSPAAIPPWFCVWSWGSREHSGNGAPSRVGSPARRTLDRLRLAEGAGETANVRQRGAASRILDAETAGEATRSISRAPQTLAGSLDTVDAVHPATAMLWRKQSAAVPVMATHAVALASAAHSVGFRVIGLWPVGWSPRFPIPRWYFGQR